MNEFICMLHMGHLGVSVGRSGGNYRWLSTKQTLLKQQVRKSFDFHT